MRVWWIFGPSGIGKSVTAWRLFEDLGHEGIACAYVDIDQLGMCYPERDTDRGRHRLAASVLSAVCDNYARGGCARLVVSGVVDPDLMRWYADRLGKYDVRFCRLTVGDGELVERLKSRGLDAEWVAESLKEARQLEAARLPHPVVDTGQRLVADVALEARVALERCPSATGDSHPQDADPTGAGTESSALWVTGPRAVGKSTVAWEVFKRLQVRATTAYLDLEQLGFTRFNAHTKPNELGVANAAAAWMCFRAAGARYLVLSGNLQSQREQLAEAISPARLRVVGLSADERTYVDRVAARGRGEAPNLAGDPLRGASPERLAAVASQAWAEQCRLAGAARHDVAYDTTARAPADVAADIIDAWW